MVGIYKITNQLNQKCYIGQSIDIKTRWQQHIYESQHDRKNNKLYIAMRKYGVNNFSFEILEECNLNQEELDNKERYWIEYYDSYNNGYNSTLGGQGENSWKYNPNFIRTLWDEGYSFNEIVKIVGCSKGIVQRRLKGYHDYNTSTSHSRGLIKFINNFEVNQIYNFTNQQKLFFSNNIQVHQYSLDGIYIASYNSYSEAARAIGKFSPGSETNISRCIKNENNQKLAYGYQWSLEKLEKMPPVPNRLGKLVRCIETNQIFHSTVEAAKWAGLKSKSGVRECCVGLVKSAGKHPITGEKLHWEYI